jgi:hypothetical protein
MNMEDLDVRNRLMQYNRNKAALGLGFGGCDMEDVDVRRRLLQINREKAAMGLGFGGCDGKYIRPDEMVHALPYVYAQGDDYEEMDDDAMFGNGILLGGIGPSKKSEAAAKRNPWIQQVKAYAAKHGISYKDALSQCGSKGKAKCGKGGKKYVKKSGSKTMKKKSAPKKKAPAKKKSIKISKYGYPKRVPSPTQLKNLGLTKKQFMELEYPKRKSSRIGYFYDRINKPGSCIKPSEYGNYFLDDDYSCLDYGLSPKERAALKKKNLKSYQKRALREL